MLEGLQCHEDKNPYLVRGAKLQVELHEDSNKLYASCIIFTTQFPPSIVAGVVATVSTARVALLESAIEGAAIGKGRNNTCMCT